MGTFLPTYAWLDALKETKGVIINVGSIASTTGIPNVVVTRRPKARSR